MNNRSLGQYGRHAKAEIHEMAVEAMRKVEAILAGAEIRRSPYAWWEWKWGRVQ